MTEQNEQPMDEFVDDPLAQTETNDEIARLTAERDELRDKWMRALADAENSRKRAENPETRALASSGLEFRASAIATYFSTSSGEIGSPDPPYQTRKTA